MATKFRISRYDSERDAKPYFQEFDLDIPKGATLLDCVNLIKWTQDGTLTYRMSCRSAICGSCAMKVNGHARLACKTQAADVVVDGTVTLEPMGNFKVVRDLAVDLEPFWESLERVHPWLEPDEGVKYDRERLQSHDDFRKIEDATTCILCASCYSDCNVLEVDPKYLGPASLAKAQRFVYDTRDARTEWRLEELVKEHGMWDCTHCAECATRCPMDAKPLDRIKELRTAAMVHKMHGTNGARHVLGFRESVGGTVPGIGGGMLNENYIPVRSVGFFNLDGILSIMPVGLRMMLRGKNPPLLPHFIEKFGEVRKMFKRFHDYRKEPHK